MDDEYTSKEKKPLIDIVRELNETYPKNKPRKELSEEQKRMMHIMPFYLQIGYIRDFLPNKDIDKKTLYTLGGMIGGGIFSGSYLRKLNEGGSEGNASKDSSEDIE